MRFGTLGMLLQEILAEKKRIIITLDTCETVLYFVLGMFRPPRNIAGANCLALAYPGDQNTLHFDPEGNSEDHSAGGSWDGARSRSSAPKYTCYFVINAPYVFIS